MVKLSVYNTRRIIICQLVFMRLFQTFFYVATNMVNASHYCVAFTLSAVNTTFITVYFYCILFSFFIVQCNKIRNTSHQLGAHVLDWLSNIFFSKTYFFLKLWNLPNSICTMNFDPKWRYTAVSMYWTFVCLNLFFSYFISYKFVLDKYIESLLNVKNF